MTESYDTLDAHLPAAGAIDRASVPMGLLLAWCVQMGLVRPEVEAEHEQLLLRIRYREARGSELLIACGGDLRRDLLAPAGQDFLDRYYAQYLDDFRSVFGPDIYAVEETWDNYARLAPLITKKFMAGSRTGGVLSQISGKLRSLWAPGR